MKTNILTCLLLVGITTTSFAQHHFGRGGYEGERPGNREFNHNRNEARCNVFIRPAFPRVVVRPCEPTIIVEHNTYRRYQEPVYDSRNIMSDEDLCRINRNLQTMRMDNDKVAYLKDQIDYVYVTSSQLSNLLYNITFEDNRLDLAKYAYRKTIDPQNYGLVYNTLTFNSTKRDLDYFIDNQSICRR